jgi:hypothetical protein
MEPINKIADSMMRDVCIDLVEGTMLTEIDDNTLKLVLESIFINKKYYTDMGVTIGIT